MQRLADQKGLRLERSGTADGQPTSWLMDPRTAAFGPFVGLLGQDRSDETADAVGASADLPVEKFVRYLPEWR